MNIALHIRTDLPRERIELFARTLVTGLKVLPADDLELHLERFSYFTELMGDIRTDITIVRLPDGSMDVMVKFYPMEKEPVDASEVKAH